jgi:DNA-binding transcriptional LysR family regulator
LERAQGLFDEARRLEEAIAAASSQLTGEVAVCLPTSLHLVVMRPFLKATADRLPDIRIRFIDAFDTVLQEQLVKKDADLGIIIHDADSSVPGLTLEPLVTDALFLIGTAGAPGDRTSIKITDLADQRLVLSIGGAEAVHMEAKIGTIEVGKCADIVLVTPMHDAVAGVALNARPDDVDTVIINGRIVKRNGSLLHAHWPTLRNRFKESCERIIDGYRSTDSASAVRAVDQWAIPRA